MASLVTEWQDFRTKEQVRYRLVKSNEKFYAVERAGRDLLDGVKWSKVFEITLADNDVDALLVLLIEDLLRRNQMLESNIKNLYSVSNA